MAALPILPMALIITQIVSDVPEECMRIPFPDHRLSRDQTGEQGEALSRKRQLFMMGSFLKQEGSMCK